MITDLFQQIQRLFLVTHDHREKDVGVLIMLSRVAVFNSVSVALQRGSHPYFSKTIPNCPEVTCQHSEHSHGPPASFHEFRTLLYIIPRLNNVFWQWSHLKTTFCSPHFFLSSRITPAFRMNTYETEGRSEGLLACRQGAAFWLKIRERHAAASSSAMLLNPGVTHRTEAQRISWHTFFWVTPENSHCDHHYNSGCYYGYLCSRFSRPDFAECFPADSLNP